MPPAYWQSTLAARQDALSILGPIGVTASEITASAHAEVAATSTAAPTSALMDTRNRTVAERSPPRRDFHFTIYSLSNRTA